MRPTGPSELAVGFVAGVRGSSGRTPNPWWQMAWSTRPRGTGGLGLGALGGGARGGGEVRAASVVEPGSPMVGARVGEGDVGVTTVPEWTWLGAEV